jgi:DNA polymerase-3 subunit alpha
MPTFSHLHCHSQFSLLDGAAEISSMIQKAKEDGMPAVALTDHGNMFGIFKFVQEAKKQGVTPIVGCEFYLVEDRHKKSFTGGQKDKRYHQLLLAKNQKGYENLSKLCSLGYIEGMYSKWPRIDMEILEKHKEGLIATSCCIGAQIPQAILHQGEEKAEKVFQKWHNLFGDDFYLELQRHDLRNIDDTGLSQEDVNQILLKWSKKYDVPAIATNDTHYLDEEDSNAHDILLCVNTGELKSTPIGQGQGKRFGFPNSQFFFKTQKEMEHKFSDVPFALDNTNLIVDKITPPELQRDVLLPNYVLPDQFKTQDDFLRHLSYEGAKKRYGEITEEIRERLDFELSIIQNTGYPGYFLIVQDFINAAKELGVAVGPGRGSAAGSAVAYCTGITNVDPIKYDLLFERFLNPERVSMPDIDIDFDDVGREKVLDYVIDKYGKDNVAQIITYGTMAAKSSIRDVGRVLDLPLSEVDKISKMVPSTSLHKIFSLSDGDLKKKLRPDDFDRAKMLQKMAESKGPEADVLKQAQALEGSIRNTGVHACGVIITPEPITNLVPAAVAKDSDLLLTQYDNNVVEKAGLLKMDFLGLKTLSIIKDAIKLVEKRHGVSIDPDEIPLDDEETFKLFQKGRTVGIFQFESDGMQKHLKDLKPTVFEDLIAMNALYRPGPMEYIPSFIARKHGKEEITYDDPEMEVDLAETYGITVYQEQVMLLSQKLAGFTKGEADSLRKAMGKKIRAAIDEMKPKFIAGATERGHDETVMEKVWKDWEAFASYAFNKSHATCYSVVAFQTAYLKSNYPPEYMAAVLTHNMNNIEKLGFFMEECKKMDIKVLPPDVNESELDFTVNAEGNIRIGMAAIKGVGEGPAEEIVRERNENGPYKSIFDLTERVNLKIVNKKSLEGLALSGGFDAFEGHFRSVLIEKAAPDVSNGIEVALKYGHDAQRQKDAAQVSLFGGDSDVELEKPKLPPTEKWPLLKLLNKEKEVLGLYISGHPLDRHKKVIEMFCNFTPSELKNDQIRKPKKVFMAGVVTSVRQRTSKKGKPFVMFQLEDYKGGGEIGIFGDDYARFIGYIQPDAMLLVQGVFKPRFYDPSIVDFKVQKLDFLQDAVDKYMNSITLKVNTRSINESLIEELESLINTSVGSVNFGVDLFDDDLNYSVTLNKYSSKIHFDDDWIKMLSQWGIKYDINKK